jgi:pimeloyl-ACP methyl ester carboxylesterase
MNNRVVRKHSGTLPSSAGNPIRYDLYAPQSESGTLPVIIFLHGFKGFKDWGTFPDAFFEIARQNFAVLAINFSHNGIGDQSDVFSELELFRTQTLSQELNDVKTVIEAVRNGRIGQTAGLHDMFPIGMIGHSRGGHTAVIAAAENDDVTCLVTWSAVADCMESWSESMINDWKTSGVTEVLNSRTQQKMPIARQLYDEVEANKSRFSARERVKELYIPCLFIHGSADETVPHRSAQRLFEDCASYEKEKILIEGANHTFGSVHPYNYDELPAHFTEVVDQTTRFFQTFLT